ncbi:MULTISPECIES: TetR family transcriptional regulator [Streptomyces]|uniref:TetR family transcriptional regulator n=1 Tax=Streptomyces lienomycini TaxID=284035 RepID=A0ABV9X765_9ACTN|nr:MULTISPECIES: TetR family transcriptional regulator [Streptomyces]
MPRTSGERAPARPTSARQRQRHARILRSAARLGAEHGLERVQMHDVARESGVAIATLYRYFPSKTHLFAAVMHAQVLRLDADTPPPPPGTGPVEAVTDLLTRASRQLFEQPLLALAMMRANNAASADDSGPPRRTDELLADLMLRTAGVSHPTERDRRVARLLQQAWYGLLVTVLYERSSPQDAHDGIRLACRLLLAPQPGHREWTRPRASGPTSVPALHRPT